MNLKIISAKIKERIAEKINPLLAGSRRNKITNTDFTIISNNCWAGNVYRYFGLQYRTPTVGLYMFADDYIKFVSKLRYYFSCDLIMITVEESKHYNELKNKGQTEVPIGKLDDIEVVFLHYSTEEEAVEKWNRRKSRVNWSNMIIKFSQMNNCNEKHLCLFDKLEHTKKIMFVSRPDFNFDSAIYFKGFEKENQISNDTLYWNKYIDIIKLINSNVEGYKI